MKIKKFNDKYEFDDDAEDIGEEYAKMIIVDYIENKINGGTLEDSFIKFTKDLYEEDENDDFSRAEIIKESLIYFTKDMSEQSKNVRNPIEIGVDKYNL